MRIHAESRDLAAALLLLAFGAAAHAGACPWSGPFATTGNRAVLQVSSFTASGNGPVNRAALQSAIACAKTALGNVWPGGDNRVTLQLPSHLVDLSQDVRDANGAILANTGSIDLSNVSCPNAALANCGTPPTATPATPPTNNRLVLAGADDGSTEVLLSQDLDQHVAEIPGVWMRNSVGVTIRNLSFNWPRMTVSQGRVTRVDPAAATVDIAIEAGYPGPDRIVDLHNFSDQGRYLHRFDVDVDPATGAVLACRLHPDDFDSAGAIEPTQLAWRGDDLQQVAPGVWRLTITNFQNGPIAVGDYVGIKSKSGLNAYDVRNSALVTFDTVTWHRRSRGVFGGASNGGPHGVTAVKVAHSAILPDAMTGYAAPCLSTPDGGPQVGQPGFPSAGHLITNNDFVSAGDDALAFFDASDATVANNTIVDAFSNRGVLFRFSAATTVTTPPTQGGSGFSVCSPGNTLVRDVYYWFTGDAPATTQQRIACP